jgi:exodeoxyribonuclease VII large subunit
MTPLSLYELNYAVSEAVEANFNATYWVAAELSEARVASNGHCYVEFVEKDESGSNIIARARGNIWRNVYQDIAFRFRMATGTDLQAGMKVLCLVSVNSHPLYGYSLTISDVDPTYTLGDIAKRRQEILEQLEREGVLEGNLNLQLPRPLRRIAVISSSKAAGFGDFQDQLAQSGYPFECTLFPAIMQGEQVEESIIRALHEVCAEADKWDCIVIIRGGGAAADLYGFESLNLAREVACCPLPILTGIGHERDETVIDFVANTRLKTPTAVAAFLIEQRRNEVDLVAELEARLYTSAQRFISHEEQNLLVLTQKLRLLAHQATAQEQERLVQFRTALSLLVKQALRSEHHKLDLLEKSLQLADPQRILSLGYSVTRLNGKVLTNAEGLNPGDVLETQLAEGTITTRVV